jgi:excisionase family DNA binding protein
MHSPNGLITVEACAEALGLKPATIRAWIARRRISIVRLGRAVRIPQTEVDRLINRGSIPALPERF